MEGKGVVEIQERSNLNIQNGLALGQQGLHLESIKLSSQAIEFYSKAVIIFQKEIITLNPQLQPTIQSLILSYSNKIQLLESRSSSEQNSEVEQLLANIDIMDPYCSSSISPLFDQKEDNLFTIQFGDPINAQVVSFESLLNIVDEFDKVRLTIQLLLRSMITGVNLSKRIFINPLVWYQQAKITNLEERMTEFQDITSKVQQILVSSKYCMNVDQSLQIGKLKQEMIAIYKAKDSKNDQSTTKLSSKIDKYAAGFLKSFQNIYKPAKEVTPAEYVRAVFRLLRILWDLFEYCRQDAPKQVNRNSSFEKDIKFIHIFTRDYFLRPIIEDLQQKFSCYLILSKSKQN